MNTSCKMWQGSVCGLLLVLLGGCSTPLPNSTAPNAADLWVGSNQGTGRWSMNPGDVDIGITRVDSVKGDFPPLSFMDTAVDLSTPLHLAPGRRSIDLLMSRRLRKNTNDSRPRWSMETRKIGRWARQFGRAAYRNCSNGSGRRPRRFKPMPKEPSGRWRLQWR
jgi:hypothetical protein